VQFSKVYLSPSRQLFNSITSLIGSQQLFKRYLNRCLLGCCYAVTQLLDIIMRDTDLSTTFFKKISIAKGQ
ncbi:hypothetical protein, partial [Aerococcus agrisoli]|uniref:hypothetical protein n=1 Tax=Aerococcus agrisoli TaxID=2487350 RepID=UPI001F26E63C